jgi:formate/nitrite transporter FocA (FNT family)
MPTTPDKKDVKAIVNDPESPISTVAEAEKVQERVAIGAKVVYEAVRLEGEEELERPAIALAWSALGRQQLFTENTLTVILPLLLHKNLEMFGKVLRLWSIVLSANIAGTFLFALLVARTHFLEPAIQRAMLDISAAHIGPDFWTIALRAVFAGWLIALMVWMMPDAASSRVFIILFITYVISICSLSHIIAGSAAVFYLVVLGKLSLARYFTAFFFPTILGNIVGGVSLVAALAHAQVLGGKK